MNDILSAYLYLSRVVADYGHKPKYLDLTNFHGIETEVLRNTITSRQAELEGVFETSHRTLEQMSEELNKAKHLVKLSYTTKTEPGGQNLEQLPTL